MNLYWLDESGFRLAIMARPRGGDWLADDIALLKRAGVQVVASILTDSEAQELELANESAICALQGLSFCNFPIEDRSVPEDLAAFRQFVRQLASDLRASSTVAVHCRAGIGRSSLVAACLLVLQGISAERALQIIEKTRGRPIPDTSEQREWIVSFEKSELRFTNPR